MTRTRVPCWVLKVPVRMQPTTRTSLRGCARRLAAADCPTLHGKPHVPEARRSSTSLLPPRLTVPDTSGPQPRPERSTPSVVPATVGHMPIVVPPTRYQSACGCRFALRQVGSAGAPFSSAGAAPPGHAGVWAVTEGARVPYTLSWVPSSKLPFQEAYASPRSLLPRPAVTPVTSHVQAQRAVRARPLCNSACVVHSRDLIALSLIQTELCLAGPFSGWQCPNPGSRVPSGPVCLPCRLGGVLSVWTSASPPMKLSSEMRMNPKFPAGSRGTPMTGVPPTPPAPTHVTLHVTRPGEFLDQLTSLPGRRTPVPSVWSSAPLSSHSRLLTARPTAPSQIPLPPHPTPVLCHSLWFPLFIILVIAPLILFLHLLTSLLFIVLVGT